ncbi:hypothetical protein J3E72DRAFT_377125 [Bipolaris maydis]|nr:hypothetical protein J3E72DRAFT_377125 [Bipolaris maydis]
MTQYLAFKIFACVLVAFLGFSANVSSASLGHLQLRARDFNPSACAQVYSLSKIWNSDPANDGYYPQVPAKLAYNCLTSVPFNQSAAVALVNNIKPMLKFQTTVARKAAAGTYANEHQFGMDLFQVIQFAHDGHLQYLPDSISTAFVFLRGTPSLVSISADGHELPRVYSFDDVHVESFGNASIKPSPITHINGENVQSFLEKESKWDYSTDLDAAYNGIFTSIVGRMTGVKYGGTFQECGDMGVVYPGPTTVLRFANGTTQSFENKAARAVPFEGIYDGETLYQTYYSTPKATPDDNQSDSQTTSSSNSTNPPKQVKGYPHQSSLIPQSILLDSILMTITPILLYFPCPIFNTPLILPSLPRII